MTTTPIATTGTTPPRVEEDKDKDKDKERASLVKVLLDAVPGGVVQVAIDGSIVEANSEALRILGFRFDELTKRYVADFQPETLHEDGSPCPVADYPVARALRTGEPQGPTLIGVRRPDGEVYWAIFRAAPTRDAKGATTGAFVTFLDMTERKRADEELKRSEEKWRSLASNLPDFVIIGDRETRIQSINRVLPDLELAKVIGTLGYTYIHTDHVDEWKRNYQGVLDTKKVVRFETRASGPNGTTVWYETIFVPIAPDDGGRVERVLTVARDVTDRRALIASLAEKERLASVGMLAASVAHEIMNPLTYVLANLDFALSDRCEQGSARQAKALLDAREGAVRMQQIVWDLRTLGRVGGEDLFYVDVRAVLETSFRLIGPDVAKHVNVVLDVSDVPGVVASESRLCQVFINLLMNAIQAMSDPSQSAAASKGELHVRTRVDDAASLVGVDISDTGTGIDPEHIGRIFDPFFTTKRTGMGLGLSISRESIERMGGRIDVTSAAGRGTTFTVWLSTTRQLRVDSPA